MSDQSEITQSSGESLKQSIRHAVEQMSVPEISALIEFAQATRQHKEETARNALVTEFRERASKLGLSLETLIAETTKLVRPAKGKGGTDKLPPKYRGPAGEEWSGRGRTPEWLTALEAKGKKREAFAA